MRVSPLFYFARFCEKIEGMFKRLLHPDIWHILAIYLILAVAYSVASPIFEAPDEINHVYLVKHLAETHTLPTFGSGEATGDASLYGQEAGQPPLYYAIGAVIVSGVAMDETPPAFNPHASMGNPLQPGNKNIIIHGPTELWPWRGLPLAVHLLRFLSIVMGAGAVFFVWKIGQGLFPDNGALALAAAAFVAFLPQFLFISAAVTNDNLIIFLSTFILWLILWLFGADFRRVPDWPEALLLGMFLGFAALSKLSGLYLLIIAGLAYLLYAITRRDWRGALSSGLLTGLTAVTIAAPWYWRNWQLYGDPTALTPFLETIGRRQTPVHFRSEFQGLRISLLGLFGWFNTPLPEAVYRVWDAFLAISAIGFLRGVWRRRLHLRPLRRYAFLITLALWLGLILLALIRWNSLTPAAQGRLLFPALASFGILTMLGWREWLPGRAWWLVIPPGLLLLTSIYGVVWVIPNAYRPPETIAPEAVPAEARRAPIIFDGHIMLVGAAAQPITVHPGETFEITLYWQAVDAIPYNASLYIHVLGRDFEDVAQVNSYPGWGSAPTSLWRPDRVLVDRYRIQLPGGVEVPTKLVVDVGMYDFDSQTPYPARLASGEEPPLGVLSLRAIPATAPDYAIAHPTDFRADGIIRLAGYDLPDEDFHPGQTLPLTLYWQGLAPITEDYQVFVHLVDERGQQVAGYDKAPVDGWWPTSQWEPGHIFDDAYPLALPADLPPGRYELRAGLYRLSDFYRLPLSGPPGQVIDNAAVLTNVIVNP